MYERVWKLRIRRFENRRFLFLSFSFKVFILFLCLIFFFGMCKNVGGDMGVLNIVVFGGGIFYKEGKEYGLNFFNILYFILKVFYRVC